MRKDPDGLGRPLTRRQDQVIARFAAGDSYAEAAANLGIALETVKTLTSSAFDRLGARSAAHAVALREERRRAEGR